MEKHTTELRSEFLEFLNDAGIALRHPRKDALVLEDLFVFPDLLLLSNTTPAQGSPAAGTINSRDLLQIEKLPSAVFISGPGDSGKTTLLKSFMKHYTALELYPIYIDANRIESFRADEQEELIRGKYEEQYTREHHKRMLSSEKNKRICLLDNFDSSCLSKEHLGSLLDEFGCLIITVSTPFLVDLSPFGLGNDRASLNFELMELSLELRRRLSEKWHNLGLDPESGADMQESGTKVENAINIMDDVIGKNLVPSYPLILLTILYIQESGGEDTPSGSSYSHYIEHLITKPIKESAGKEGIKAFTLYLSKLANLMFKERKSSVTALELTRLHDGQPETLKLPGEAEDTIQALLNTRTLSVKETGFKFTYRYIYYYFTADYLARNLGLESVWDNIRRLYQNLGDEEHANIMLFLTHLSEDPFILKEITAALESSEIDISADSVDEEIREIDELIESILRTADKDRKLREIRAEYSSQRERVWVPPPSTRGVYQYTQASDVQAIKQHLENTHRQLRLLCIAGELLTKLLLSRPEDPTTRAYAQKLYHFWLRSLAATSHNLLRSENKLPKSTETSYSRVNTAPSGSEEYIQQIKRYFLALNIFSHYISRLSLALGNVSLSITKESIEDRVPPQSFELFELLAIPWREEGGIPCDEIEMLIGALSGPFPRELIRQSGVSYIRKFYEGTEQQEQVSELEKSLSVNDKT